MKLRPGVRGYYPLQPDYSSNAVPSELVNNSGTGPGEGYIVTVGVGAKNVTYFYSTVAKSVWRMIAKYVSNMFFYIYIKKFFKHIYIDRSDLRFNL